MEFIFEILFEFAGEFLLNVIGEALLEVGLHAFAAPFRPERSPTLAAFGYGLLGCAVGGVTLIFFPEHLVPSAMLRWANLVVTPLACGGVMAAFGAWRRRRGEELLRIDRFAYGFLFSVSFALVRFLFAH